jgi:hypothetical protein
MNTTSKQEIVHRLEQKGGSLVLTIHAIEKNSSDQLIVNENEIYRFTCDSGQRWKDWYISSGPKGFFNPFAILAGLRIKKYSCFCLCGVYDKRDSTAFKIGNGSEEKVRNGGTISFFANDSLAYYKNNSGYVRLRIDRLA